MRANPPSRVLGGYDIAAQAAKLGRDGIGVGL
jgi:hypothetical protein